nr:ankyrin repeat-containing protein [Tanacetum cinerariifolium]
MADEYCFTGYPKVKLSGHRNYHIWKAQMLSLLDKLMIRDIVENRTTNLVEMADEYCFTGYPKEKVLIKIQAEDPGKGFPIDKLRDATRKGNWRRAQSILRRYRFEITQKINNVGETMLHLAVREGKNYFVQKLLNSIQNEELIEEENNKGQTALHIAALVGNKDAAEILVMKMDSLLYVKDNFGEVPLVTAYSNNQISMFTYLLEVTKTAGDLLPIYHDSFEEFIIRLIYRKEYALAFKLYNLHLESMVRPSDKVLMALTRNFPSSVGKREELIYPDWENACQNIVKRSSFIFYSFDYLSERAESTFWRMKRFKNNCYSWLLPEIVMLLLLPIAVLYPLYQLILLFISVLLLPFYILYSLLWKHLATVVAPIKDIEKRKREYKEALYFLDTTVRYIECCNLDKSLFYKFIALEAVRLDVLAPSNVLSRTTGAALQLQRELQWREEVEKFMEPMQLTDLNIDNETPDMVFTREHANLVNEGEKWLKATAESCIITAALIVTIVFAAAITVPVGSNQETGIPLFKKQIAFTVFAISDAISLFSAVTSLLVFLSIFLDARFTEKDFLLSLPRRLFIALDLLTLSTISMISAFSAVFYLVFCDQRPWMVAPIGAFTCMPIAAIVSLQLPLVRDLYRSTYFSMFVPIAVLYPLYQLILLFISVLLLPFYMLYSLPWKHLTTVGWHLHMNLVVQQAQHYNYNESYNGEVKNFMEPMQLTEKNIDNETPEE